MSVPLEGLRAMGDFLAPSTLMVLRRAGALDFKGPLASIGYLPWLIGRGPSLGMLAYMNSFALGDKPAIHDRNGMVTWAGVNERSNRLAHAIEAAGVRPGQRVAQLVRNGREWVEIVLAAQKLGVVACPFNTWAKSKELQSTLASAGPALLFHDAAHSETVDRWVPKDLARVVIGDAGDEIATGVSYEEFIAGQPGSPPTPFVRNRAAPKIIIQTSGTTGVPKGASRNAAAAGFGALANVIRTVPYRREDVVLCPCPLFHSFGLLTFVISAALGATVVLPDRFEAEDSLESIEKQSVTAASFVPIMIQRVLALPDSIKSRYDLSSLRIVMASGSALSERMREGARELFGDVLYDLYGSTEVGWIAIATPPDMRRHPTTVGKPVPRNEVAVFTAEGRRLGPEQRGELFIKSDVTFEGYTSGESREQREGFMSVGDIGHLDEEGYIYVEGRTDDMVAIGGENVYPIEIEETIERIPGVREVAVVGIPDDEYGHLLAAFVSGDASPEEITDMCKRELASYKVPRRIEVLEELPRTTTGKVLKRDLTDALDRRASG
jgi:acyl-CoA synthetase (AMP-forming)/AMP-acid ligase II